MKQTKIKKILLVVVILIIISNYSLAKYRFTYKLDAFKLSRDNSEILYNVITDVDENKYVNRDVMLRIYFNKEIEKIDGFELSEDSKTLSKVLHENESNSIIVQDISGNKKTVEYAVNNIDKVPPEIVGIQDGETYTSNIKPNYIDNIGVEKIFIDKYSKLGIAYYPDYYETNFYKGINITSNRLVINLSGHPKGTRYYNYYLNNVLKAQTSETSHLYTGLTPGTNYTVKIEALDENKNVLSTLTRDVKTKYCTEINGVRNDTNKTFTINLRGIDSRIKSATCVGFIDSNTHKSKNVSISSDRSLTYTFKALDITSTLQSGYYYFHVQLWDASQKLVETICCNIIFNSNYVVNNKALDPYDININGNYQIIVTDFAGNVTEKNIILNKS